MKAKKHLQLNTGQTIAIAFALIIAVGTMLLALPAASKDGQSCGIMTALFTSTSAVCVTGLSLVDVWSSFSIFGQAVILLLMETGGLGFMSILAIVFYMSNRKYSIRSLSLMADSLGSDGLRNIGRIQKELLIGSLLVEIIGAAILCSCFCGEFDFKTALWLGIFHSVSAFCNAGFDLMGIKDPGSSLLTYQNNPTVLITVALLIVIGGIGFIVWDDIITSKRIQFWSVNTKLVLCSTGVLIALGTAIFYFLEADNPNTFADLPTGTKLANAFFQSVTPRTAGFASADQASLNQLSVAFTTLLMFIGGSAGSTAGGMKTVTFLIVLTSFLSNAAGKQDVILMHRQVSKEQVMQAYTVAFSFVALSFMGGFLICFSTGFNFGAAYFESVSALATVGLSLGITASLDTFSKLILILFMYIGRVGLLNITIGFFHSEDPWDVKYPPVKIMIG